MKTLWQRLLHKIARKLHLYGTLDSEKALREKNRKIHALEQQVEQLEQQVGFAQQAIAETTIKRLQAVVYIDPAKQGAYDQPSPNTDPELKRRLEARKRKDDMKKFLQVNTLELPKVPGDMVRKYTTQKLKPITLDKPGDVAPDEKWIV